MKLQMAKDQLSIPHKGKMSKSFISWNHPHGRMLAGCRHTDEKGKLAVKLISNRPRECTISIANSRK